MGDRTYADCCNYDTFIALDLVDLEAEFPDSVTDVLHLLLGGAWPH
jgi:hypothetical protein